MINWQMSRRNLVDTGRNKPIKFSHQPLAPREILVRDDDWIVREDDSLYRQIEVGIYNRSSIPQTISLYRLRVLWPRCEKNYKLVKPIIETDMVPNQGGTLPLLVNNADWDGLRRDTLDDIAHQFATHTIWLYMKGKTLSGHTVRYLGRAEIRMPYSYFPRHLLL